MITTFFFIIVSMVYNIVLCYLFFHKNRIKSPEITIFGYLLIVNIIGLILELYNRCSIYYFRFNDAYTSLTCKIFLLYYIVYIVLFFNYFLAISFSTKKYKKFSIIFNIFSLIASVGCGYYIYNLPFEINTNNGIYLTGPAVETLFSIMSVFLILIILIYIIRYRYIDKNKYIPCLAFIIISGLFGVIQKYFPFITLTTSMQTVVLYIMYSTIENPDAKMLQRVNLAKLLIEKSNNSKNDLINNISQEIRNPLNSIIGFSEDIKKYKDKIPAEISEDINYILESSNDILDVIDNDFDIKENDFTELELVLKPYSLKKVVNSIKNRFKSEIDDDISFTVNYDNTIPEKLVGDKTYITEIINNLLSMSLDKTKNGEIELYIKGDIDNNKCNLLFIIKDTGIGYKKEELLELRNIGDGSKIRENESNIIFAITKSLVNLMDGKVEIESKYKNGTTISVIIQQDIFVEGKTEEENILVDHSSKHILVVDDNELNVKVLTRALSDFKIKIDSVSSGEAAIEKVSKGNKYDLILMDIMMPKLSGIETLQKLKEDKKFNTKTVALTADASNKAREKYLKIGFVDYISKPFSKNDIKKKINSLLK